MCCHELYIHTVCGHSALSDHPLMECRHASIEPGGTFSSTCELVAHPYRSWRIEKLCPPCQEQRDKLMGQFEEAQVVKFDEWKWKVSYGMPAHGGKDYWSLKAEAKSEESKEEKEQKSPRNSGRFSLKRKSTRKSAERARAGLSWHSQPEAIGRTWRAATSRLGSLATTSALRERQ